MSSTPRGICLIVNNADFPNGDYLYAADPDQRMLEDLFEELLFDVVVKRDLTGDEIRAAAEEYAAKDHSQYNAFVFYILSHGRGFDDIYGVDDSTVPVAELVRLFVAANCPSLQGKPKLFFIEACRRRPRRSASAQARFDAALLSPASPLEADFLLAFSTAPGYGANTTNEGSWFTRVSMYSNTSQPCFIRTFIRTYCFSD